MVLYELNVMGSYYYVSDENSDLGFTPVPEDEYMQAILRIAKKHGLEITDAMILQEIEKTNREKGQIRNLTRGKRDARIILLKSPALAC